MTNAEFSNQFDILYNNIMSNAAPGLDEYEKSVFLTQAQRDIIIGIYNGREVPGLSFESVEESRRYLSELVKEKEIKDIDFKSLIGLPDKLWFITLEQATFDSSKDPKLKDYVAKVVPVKQDYLTTYLKNPFKGPSKDRVLRVDIEGKVKLYSKYDIKTYYISYIEKPTPIILEDLSESYLTIDGISEESESNVNPLLHEIILKRAVTLAKAAYIGN